MDLFFFFALLLCNQTMADENADDE